MITNFTIKILFWDAEIFLKMCSQKAGNAISETQILKIPWFCHTTEESILKKCAEHSIFFSSTIIQENGFH